MSVRTVCLIAVLAFSEAAGQQSSVVPIGPPFGSANQLVSPDGALGLFGIDQVAQLWLEDIRTRRRRLVLTATVQTLTVAWSPDSAAFIVNDRETSDLEFAYVYDSKTLDRLDLRGRILVTDPKAVRFVPGVKTAPHSYFHAIRWLDSRQVELQLHGHTDVVRRGGNVLPGASASTSAIASPGMARCRSSPSASPQSMTEEDAAGWNSRPVGRVTRLVHVA